MYIINKNNRKSKIFIFSLVLAALMMVTLSLNAQRYGSRGLFDKGFRSAEEEEEFDFRGLMDITDSGEGAYNLSNQQFGIDEYGGYHLSNQFFGQEDTPLGSGLLILSAAAAGYALRKKNHNKKHKS